MTTTVILTEVQHRPRDRGHVSAHEIDKAADMPEPIVHLDVFPAPAPDPVPCPFCGVPGGSHRRTCASPFRG